MQNVLRFQPLHQPVSDQLIVFRSAQMSRHIFECREESREILIVIKLLDFGEGRSIHPMTLPKLEQSRRLDGSFKMQMKLGLRQRKDETGWLRRHSAILKQSAHLTDHPIFFVLTNSLWWRL